jgi:hypothetical protein
MKILTFESQQFRPYLPDDCQVNPNVLGFELASWLSRALAEAGVVTSYPISEDWGWFLEKTAGGAEYMICCSGSATERGSHEWKIFVTQPKRLFRRPVSGDEDDILEQIADVLRKQNFSVRIEQD